MPQALADELGRRAPAGDGGWPVFDLLLLGIGADGHVLSVFPGSPALGSRELALAIPAPSHIEPRVERVTLNPGGRRSGRPRPGGRKRRRQGRRSWRRSSARRTIRAAGRPSSPGERGPPGSSTPRPRRDSAAEHLAGTGPVAPDRLRRRDADRRLHHRRRAAADPGPWRRRRPHDVPGGRPAAGALVHRPCNRPAWARRVGRQPAVRDRARVRGRRRGRRGARRRRRRGRSPCSATRTAAGVRSGRPSGSDRVGRVICYEGAPAPPGSRYEPGELQRSAAGLRWRPATSTACWPSS